MEIQAKHRIIMIIVILALLVIFVPMLFSKRAREKLSSIIIPANPATPTVVSDATTPAVAAVPSAVPSAIPSSIPRGRAPCPSPPGSGLLFPGLQRHKSVVLLRESSWHPLMR